MTNHKLIQELNKAAFFRAPDNLFFAYKLDEEIELIRRYIASFVYPEKIRTNQAENERIREIGYNINVPFERWYQERVKYYRDEEKKLCIGIPLKRNKDAEEKECMRSFLVHENKNLEEWQINKPQEDEIVDVEAVNKNSCERIKAQIRFLQPREAGELGARRWTSSGYTVDSLIQLIIRAIEEKSRYPMKSTQDVYLLLHSIFDIPDIWLQEIRGKLDGQNFEHWKGIYIVCPHYNKNVRIK